MFTLSRRITLSNSAMEGLNSMRTLFKLAYHSVLPDELVKKVLKVDTSTNPATLHINSSHSVPIFSQIHIAAFGKASLGMSRAVQDIIGDKLLSGGIVSAPLGSIPVLEDHGLSRLIPTAPQLRIFQGAKDNYPDEQSAMAALQIEIMAEKLKESDVLLVLVSGGGSALLPAPIQGLSLEEKTDLIKALSRGGATISQLNTVRQHFSRLKGGKLAKLAYPATVITLIFSDIIGNDLQFIASGPTVQPSTTVNDCLSLLENILPESMLKEKAINLLKNSGIGTPDVSTYNNTRNILIGDSQTALDSIQSHIHKTGANCWIVSNNLEGEAKTRGRQFAEFLYQFIQTRTIINSSTVSSELIPSTGMNLDKYLSDLYDNNIALYMLWGGETTVNVLPTGAGKGGRCQELMLAYLIRFKQLMDEGGVNSSIPYMDISLLCGGTDGQDGPTDAAGALIHISQIINMDTAIIEEACNCLSRNDSYNFFTRFLNGNCHLKTGLTGTNVMDITILKINRV